MITQTGTIAMIFFFLGSVIAHEKKNSTSLNVGDTAPDFALPYATKDTIIFTPPLKLSELVGKRNIVLAFYPADWSGGCTKEVCTLRDNFGELEKLDAEILPISGDYVYSHKEWAKYHNLPFKLLSDHDHTVAKMYDSYNEVAGYNKRTVYVIDKSGKIAYMNLQYNVRTPDDFEKLQSILASLK
jgi:peroxiredoxin